MVNLKPHRGWLQRLASPHVFFFASAILCWPLFAELELFELLHEFSRSHEDWEVDELAILIVNLTLALLLSSYVQSRKLRRVMSKLQVEKQRSESNARHDPLTGLLNRRAFSAALEDRARSSDAGDENFVAVVDLDKFKPINDLNGHAAGDATLEAVARRLEKTLNATDTVARLGGDEFAVAFGPGTDAVAAERSVRRLMSAIEQPIELDAATVMISCSVGLGTWKNSMTGSEVLERADRALYNAKRLGRARFAWYNEDLDRASRARAELEYDLRVAIKNNHIEPWFQPIVDIETSSIKGFEVLARWNHETRGQVPPGVFIEIAEDSGMIGELGFNLLQSACDAARDWSGHLTISFNISARQFQDTQLVTKIEKTLADCRFDPARLIIEVTESSIISDFEAANVKLKQLKALGISVALDDFGTGYSSLASLRQLPFDRLKIDREFVTDIGDQPQKQKIVAGIMELARGLELGVTAEGIETIEDLDYLQQLDCPLGQGFLFGKAISADKVLWNLESTWIDGRVDLSNLMTPDPSVRESSA